MNPPIHDIRHLPFRPVRGFQTDPCDAAQAELAERRRAAEGARLLLAALDAQKAIEKTDFRCLSKLLDGD